MKQIIFIFMSLLCFSCSSKVQNQIADTNIQSDKKILVAYFSCTLIPQHYYKIFFLST